jgi:hypothetical protein
MSEEATRQCWEAYEDLRHTITDLSFAERVQMIHKLSKLIVETLDGMEAEVKKECP